MAVILIMRVTKEIEERLMMMRVFRERVMTRMIVTMMEMRIVIAVWRTDPRTDNVTCSCGLGPHLGKSSFENRYKFE